MYKFASLVVEKPHPEGWVSGLLKHALGKINISGILAVPYRSHQGGTVFAEDKADMFLQRTLKFKTSVEGIGLHTGEPCRLSFCPAPAGTGVHFVRRDLAGEPSVAVTADFVRATTNATTLGGEAFTVSTVEHCLSALAALRIDNLIIELEGPEIPACDGSARDFLTAITKVGVIEQDEARKYAYITHPIFYGTEEKHAYVVPYQGLRITCTIDFPHPKIGRQKIDLDINEESFTQGIAGARTFGFMKDVEALKARGLARGGTLENALVLGERDILNPEGLRFADECVRHKVLDALGDLVTLGHPLMGHVVLHKAGHDIMNKLVKKILSSPECFRFVEMGEHLEDELLSSHTLTYA